jgi:hypothetical protein
VGVFLANTAATTRTPKKKKKRWCKGYKGVENKCAKSPCFEAQYPERFLLCWLTSSKIWLIPLVDDRSLYNYMIKLNEKHSAACQLARPNFFQ